MLKKSLLIMSVFVFLASLPGAMAEQVLPLPYPQRVPCPGIKAEIKMLNGAPAFFVDDKPHSGLMSYATKPRPVIEDEQLVLTCRQGWYKGRSIVVNRELNNNFIVEATVSVKELLASNGNVSIQALTGYRGSFYFLGLQSGPNGRRIDFLKYHGNYYRWLEFPFNWEIGKEYRLKLVIDGNKISGYVDGKLIGERIDDADPLPIRYLLFSVFHSISSVDDVKLTNLDGKVLFKDDFSEVKLENWSGADMATEGQLKRLTKRNKNISHDGLDV